MELFWFQIPYIVVILNWQGWKDFKSTVFLTFLTEFVAIFHIKNYLKCLFCAKKYFFVPKFVPKKS